MDRNPVEDDVARQTSVIDDIKRRGRRTMTGNCSLIPAAITHGSSTALPIPLDMHRRLLAGCKAVASKIVSRGPTAVALAKQAVRRGVHMPLGDGLQLEADLFGIASSTAEMKEGMAAFLEKRKPSWLRS